jgi:hypothetical protein
MQGGATRLASEELVMDKDTLKSLDAHFKQLGSDVKKCRAGLGALQSLAAFNGTSQATVLTIAELLHATDELAKDARIFAKAVGDLSSSVSAE